MVDSSTDEQLGRFLGRVDEVADLLARMNSPDEQLRRAALVEADRTIQHLHDDQEEVDGCRVRLDRTVIAAAPAPGSMEGKQCPEMSQGSDVFVSLLEKDARERADRRRKNELLALGLKERGNAAFQEGDFASALALYSEGLDACRDLEVLYTNRAQTFLKLGRPAEALADCEWALRCNERSVKARVLMGKSHQALGQFTEAQGTYEAVLAADPTHKILIQGLLRALERERLCVEEEREARAQLSGADPHAARSLLAALGHLRGGVGSSAQKLARDVQSLASSIHSPTTRALFRIEEGFEIITGNATLLRSLCGCCVGEEETALCVSLLQLLHAACQDDDASVGRLLASLCRAATERARTAEGEATVPLLGALRSAEAEVRLHAVRLLRTLSQTEAGREQLLRQFDVGRLLSAVASTLPSVPASLPLDVITQLGTHPRFRRWLRVDEGRALATLLAPLERCLARGEPTRPDAEHLAPCIAALDTLAGYGGAVRAALAARHELWDACLGIADRCAGHQGAPLAGALLHDLVGLLLRLAEEDNDTVQGIAGRVTRTCLPLLDDPSDRTAMMSLALLGRVLPRSEVAINDAVSAGVVSSLLGFLEARDGRVAVLAARPLAVVTQKNAAARGQLAESRAGLDALLALLEGPTGAGEGLEGAQGNAALCLGHCAASPLLRGRAVPALLHHAARSDAPPALRANCAIALAKMCRAQPRFARRLRRREHGMELLRDCAQLLD